MNKDYESIQKEIDKLLEETSEERTNKRYQEIRTAEHYKSAMKKIGKLIAELEKIEEEKKKEKRRRNV